jgi:PAS domain S-box-containing protein
MASQQPNPSEPGLLQGQAQQLAEVRRRAESRLANEPEPAADAADSPWAERMVHELSVHQIELEMQNEELRQTQAALEDSRDRYVDLYENAPLGYVTLGVDGSIVEANHRALSLFGAPAPRIQGRRLVDLIAPGDRPRMQQHFAKLLGGAGEQHLELRLHTPRREPIYVATRMSLVAERAVGAQVRVGMIDITARVRSEAEAMRLAAVVSSTEDAIISRDLDGRVTSWNDSAARLFGRSAKQMFGRTMDELVPPDRRDEEAELLQRLRRGEKVSHHETERLNAAGTPVPIAISLSPISGSDGSLVGSSLIARDISERRRIDRALRQRLRQLGVLSQAGQALILGESAEPATRAELFQRVGAAVGSDLVLHYAVIAGADMTSGLALESSRGFSDDQLAALRDEPLTHSLAGMIARERKALVLNDLRDSTLPEVKLLRDAGARCLAGFPLIAQGRLHGVAMFTSTLHDLLHEGDLQVVQTVCDQVSAMLERARLLDELHANERSLKRADRAKDDFIATLAHELRNPLAPIRNAVGIMRHHGERGNAQQLAWCRDIIERQVVQMTRLLEDLLDVSRVTRNKIELRRERLDLRQAIEQAIEATRPLIESRQQQLALEVPGEPIVLYGDLTRLTQVFSNLLNNAAKYTDVGGTITVSATPGATRVRVGVRDSSIGIEAQHLTSVFDMFSQLAPALDRSGGGLGIGLALTRGLVELHGGTIDAYSAGIGHGSEFVVNLPTVANRAVEPDRGGEGDSAEPPAPRRMLVVDDNADAAQTLTTLLAMAGQDVRTAFNGEDAMNIVTAWPPDVAVLDIGLPDFNGYELCRRIRAQPWGERPLLIACTGWGQREDVDRAREAGFDFHLVKPVDPQAVLHLLNQSRHGSPAH